MDRVNIEHIEYKYIESIEYIEIIEYIHHIRKIVLHCRAIYVSINI